MRMTSRDPNEAHSPTQPVEYLSPPAQVSMGDEWFDITSADHFWIQRRFEVAQILVGDLILRGSEMAEIGCGHGLLQRQVEDNYGRGVTGFDLNEYALKRNISRRSAVICYDILERAPRFGYKFDMVFLFDVLEHLTDEREFLQAVRFHMADGASLLLNVPAGQWAYSAYDEAVGHVRRYSIATLLKSVADSGLRVTNWTYWGLPFIPILALRKMWLMVASNKSKVISRGMETKSPAANKAMRMVSRFEKIPQCAAGTSLMAVLRTETR
jgi:hypothetical protein